MVERIRISDLERMIPEKKYRIVAGMLMKTRNKVWEISI